MLIFQKIEESLGHMQGNYKEIHRSLVYTILVGTFAEHFVRDSAVTSWNLITVLGIVSKFRFSY